MSQNPLYTLVYDIFPGWRKKTENAQSVVDQLAENGATDIWLNPFLAPQYQIKVKNAFQEETADGWIFPHQLIGTDGNIKLEYLKNGQLRDDLFEFEPDPHGEQGGNVLPEGKALVVKGSAYAARWLPGDVPGEEFQKYRNYIVGQIERQISTNHNDERLAIFKQAYQAKTGKEFHGSHLEAFKAYIDHGINHSPEIRSYFDDLKLLDTIGLGSTGNTITYPKPPEDRVVGENAQTL